jgi:hypothetical protein
MSPRTGLLILATLFATAAFADPGVGPVPPSAAAPAPEKAPPAEPKTVEGLTVTRRALPTTECSPRDKQCIQLVVAELKRLYPEQLKRFCFQRQMRDIRSNILNETDPGQTPFTSIFSSPAPLKLACSSDKAH